MRKIMFILWLGIVFLIKNSYEIECKYCNEDFVHVKKHKWRCKVRINRDEVNRFQRITEDNSINRGTVNDMNHDDAININDPLVDNLYSESSLNSNDPADETCNHTYQCYCGRYFDSLRGMNSHRRACFVTEHPYLSDLLVIREPLEDS